MWPLHGQRWVEQVCSTPLGLLAVSLKCSILFFADLVGKTATSYVSMLTVSVLFTKWKGNIWRSYSSSKKLTWLSFRECVKQRYLKRGTTYSDHVPALVHCRSQFQPFTTSAFLWQSLAGSEKGTDITALLLPGNHICVTPILPVCKSYCPWSHYSLASSRGKLRKPPATEEHSTWSKSKALSTKENNPICLLLLIFGLSSVSEPIRVHFIGICESTTRPYLQWCQVVCVVDLHWVTPSL